MTGFFYAAMLGAELNDFRGLSAVSDSAKKSDKQEQKAERDERLNNALRANLRKRKQQARKRAENGPEVAKKPADKA